MSRIRVLVAKLVRWTRPWSQGGRARSACRHGSRYLGSIAVSNRANGPREDVQVVGLSIIGALNRLVTAVARVWPPRVW